MDVSDITSKEIHNLRARWNRKMRDDQVGWDSFDDFLRWSVENGYKQGREIRKKDYGKPHSKSNTFFFDIDCRDGFCKGCKQKCPTGGKCPVWGDRFVKNWNANIYIRPKPVPKVEEPPKQPVREKFKIYHPDEIRRMMGNG